jgi:hypothetical protein
LEELHDLILVVLEAGNLPLTRVYLLEAWTGLADNLDTTIDDDETNSCESRALTFLERLV